MTGELRLRIGAGLAAATVVLLVVAAVGAPGMSSEDRRDGPEALAVAGSSIDDLVPEPTPPTSPALTPAPTGDGSTSPAAVPAPAPAANAPPTTPAAPAPPTSAAGAKDAPPVPNPPPPLAAGPSVGPPPTIDVRQTFAISPTSGSGTTGISANGTGCTGASAGASLTIFGPAGLPVAGHNATAAADGVWRVPFTVGANAAPGSYSVQAACRSGAQVLFVYPPQAFTVTG